MITNGMAFKRTFLSWGKFCDIFKRNTWMRIKKYLNFKIFSWVSNLFGVLRNTFLRQLVFYLGWSNTSLQYIYTVLILRILVLSNELCRQMPLMYFLIVAYVVECIGIGCQNYDAWFNKCRRQGWAKYTLIKFLKN